MQDISKVPGFDFYDIVQVVDIRGEIPQIDRKFAVVLGMSQTDDGVWGFAVDICVDGTCQERTECWDVPGDCLVSTGRRLKESDVYDDASVRVSREGEEL